MKFISLKKKMTAACLTAAMTFSSAVTRVLADDYTDFLSDSDSHILDPVTNTVKGLASEATSVIKYAAIFMIVIGIIIAAVQLSSNNPQKKENAKSRLAMLILGAILVFAAIGILIFAQNLGNSFGGALQNAGGTVVSGGAVN